MTWIENRGWRRAFRVAREAKLPTTLELEIMFKYGLTRTIPAKFLEPDEEDFWIYPKA